MVEVAIPFKTLSIDPSKTTSGLQVFRGVARIEVDAGDPDPYKANFGISLKCQ